MGANLDVTDPQTQGLIAKWASVAVSAVLAALGLQRWASKRRATLDARFDKKADKHTVNNALATITSEQTLHRTYFSKVFDQMRENEQRAQDRYERLMERLPAK